MRQRVFQFCVVILTALLLVSCSGVPKSTAPPPGGNATLSLTMIDTPPANSSILSFKVVITGITLNPASGSPFSLPLPTSPSPVVELTRLQSDSAFLRTFATVPAGTYNSMTIALGTAQITFANQTGGSITVGTSTCANNSVCTASATPVQPSAISFAPSPLNLTSAPQGLSLDFNLNNAITFTGGTLGVDFSQAKAVSVATLPRSNSNLSSGQLDRIEDFTGVATSVNATTKSVTVKSETRGTITATANSNTVFDNDPSGTICTTPTPDFSCVNQNQTVSIDAVLNADGTFTIQEFEPLFKTPEDLIEGVISSVSPTSATQFQLVVSEKVLAATSALSGVNVGDPIQITIAANPTFFVDLKDIGLNPTRPVTLIAAFNNSANNAVLFPGQVVAVHVTGFTAASGNNIAAATVDEVVLRWTRVTGVVSGAPTFLDFNITGLPAYMPAGVPLNGNIPSFPANVRVQTFQSGTPGATNFDGIVGVSALQNANRVSIRALYFGPSAQPAFCAAKVRLQP